MSKTEKTVIQSVKNKLEQAMRGVDRNETIKSLEKSEERHDRIHELIIKACDKTRIYINAWQEMW